MNIVVFIRQLGFCQVFQILLCQETSLFLFSFGAFYTLKNSVVEEAVLIGIVEDTSQFLEIQPYGAGHQALRLEILDKVLEIGGADFFDGGVTISLKMSAHKTIRIFGLGFNVG